MPAILRSSINECMNMTTCCEPRQAAPAAIDAADLAVLCKALAHPARVQLLTYLAAYGACYFGSLAEILPLAPSTISKHVSILKDAGLIVGSADEQRVCYCVNAERLQAFKSIVAQL
jgi:ArsR family transcriptional regulator